MVELIFLCNTFLTLVVFCLSCRFSYFLSAVRPTNMGNALSKLDLQTGEVQTWHTPGGAVGERHGCGSLLCSPSGCQLCLLWFHAAVRGTNNSGLDLPGEDLGHVFTGEGVVAG
jgi:hypothetical protein